MPEFRRSRSEMDAAGIEAAHLPGLDMTFVEQRALKGADQIFIGRSAAPRNECGRALPAASGFALRAPRPAAIDEVEALLQEPGAPSCTVRLSPP